MQGHKRSLGRDEDNVKRIHAHREELWNKTIVIF